MLPSCPVFIACSISSASAPRHSPTIIRSGRIRSDALIRSRIVISRTPSILAVLVSRRIRFGTDVIWSSAESSIVMTRSPFGIYADSAFKKVVFPAPVPPDTKILYPACTSCFRKSTASLEMAPRRISCSISIGCSGNLRIVTAEPSIATGESTIFTREPSLSLVSAIGFASFTILLPAAAICWITSSSFSLE